MTDEQYKQWWNSISDGDAESVLSEISHIDSIPVSEVSVARQVGQLAHHAFIRLREHWRDKPDSVLANLERLIPLCATRHEEDLHAGVPFMQCRETLAKLIMSYPAYNAQKLLDAAVGLTLPFADGNTLKPACWFLQDLGLRDARVVGKLEASAEARADTAGDVATTTLIWLGVPDDKRDLYLKWIHRRALERLNLQTYSGLAGLADARTVPYIRDILVTVHRTKLDRQAVEHLAYALVSIAAQHDDSELSDEIAKAIVQLTVEFTDELLTPVFLGGSFLPECASPISTRLLLSILADGSHVKAKNNYHRWLAHLRLGECVAPRHLDGMDVAEYPTITTRLMEDIGTPVSSDTQGSSLEDWLKRDAWITAFRLGCNELPQWLQLWVDREPESYSTSNIVEDFAVFRIEPLPPRLVAAIKQRRNITKSSHSKADALAFAAPKLARCAGTEEAFEVLLDPGLEFENDVLLETVESLTDVALMIGAEPARRDWVVARLLDTLSHSEVAPQQAAVCRALQAFAANGLLPQYALPAISTAFLSGRIRAHSAARLAQIFGYLPLETVPEEILASIRTLAADNHDVLGDRALEVLARRKELAGDLDLLTRRLGVKVIGDGFDWQSDLPQSSVSGALLGLLYLQYPERFEIASCTLLHRGTWLHVQQFLQVIKRPDGGAPTLFGKPLVETLFLRLHEKITRFSAELFLFEEMVHCAPSKLASENWSLLTSKWLPDARVALADVLGLLLTEPVELRQRAALQLASLASDGNFAVRRAAFRALSEIAPEFFESLITQLSESQDADDRWRAAEAVWWVHDTRQESRLALIKDNLCVDTHKQVRKAAAKGRKAARRRKWAAFYLKKILGIGAATNAEVMRLWKFGHALAHTGDDDTIRQLNEYAGRTALPANARYFIGDVLEKLEKNWKKVQEKWPQPLELKRGVVERGRGTIHIRERSVGVEYEIWGQPAMIERATQHWGGFATAASEDQFPQDALGIEATLTTDDGRTGTILVHSTQIGSWIGFTGQRGFQWR